MYDYMRMPFNLLVTIDKIMDAHLMVPTVLILVYAAHSCIS